MRKTHFIGLGGGSADDMAAIAESIIWLSDAGAAPNSGLVFDFDQNNTEMFVHCFVRKMHFFSHINCSADCASAVIDMHTDLWLGNPLPGLTFAERQFRNSQHSDFARCADWVFYRGLGCPRSHVRAGRACLRGTGCGGNGGCGLGWVSRKATWTGFGSCQPRQNKTRPHILTCNI